MERHIQLNLILPLRMRHREGGTHVHLTGLGTDTEEGAYDSGSGGFGGTSGVVG